jgi:hypothetical protein
VEEEEKARRNACQQYVGEELFQMLLECYTIPQLRMKNSLRLGEDSTSNIRPPTQNLKFIKVRIVS